MNQSKWISCIKTNYAEIIAFFLFSILTIVVSFFHEPWFDELQAWGIAKSNLYDILFVIPHTEGHTPLWYIILKIFQQFTVNPELVIKIPNLIFMFGAVYLLIFKSPFPKIIRLSLPFTYFLFYQYSIIGRPYSVLIFAIFLSAAFFKNRNTSPFKFIFGLALMSCSCVYGMVIATGIAIVWGIEILKEQRFISFIKSFLVDKRLLSLGFLFFLCLFITIEIIPDKNILTLNAFEKISVLQKFLYYYFALPADAAVADVLNYYSYGINNICTPMFVYACIMGIAINVILFYIFSKTKGFLYFVVPYVLMLTTAFLAYLSTHHIGIITVVVIFAFWCLLSTEKFPNIFGKKYLVYFVLFVIGIQIFWSISSSVLEVKYNYSAARGIANFIKENKLEKYKIFSSYYIDNDDEYVNVQSIPASVVPYFNKNIFCNYNTFNKLQAYTTLLKTDKEQVSQVKKEWEKSCDFPDIIVCEYNVKQKLEEMNNYIKMNDYITAASINAGYIWKGKIYPFDKEILIHKNIYKNLKGDAGR